MIKCRCIFIWLYITKVIKQKLAFG